MGKACLWKSFWLGSSEGRGQLLGDDLYRIDRYVVITQILWKSRERGNEFVERSVKRGADGKWK